MKNIERLLFYIKRYKVALRSILFLKIFQNFLFSCFIGAFGANKSLILKEKQAAAAFKQRLLYYLQFDMEIEHYFA